MQLVSVVLAQSRHRYGALALHLVDGVPLVVRAVRSLNDAAARVHPARPFDAHPVLVVVPAGVSDEVSGLLKEFDCDAMVAATSSPSLDGAMHTAIDVLSRGGVPDRFGAGSRAERASRAGAPRTGDTGEPIVVLHDVRRALAGSDVVQRVLDAAISRPHRAVVAGLSVVDTVKQIDSDGRIVTTVARESLMHVQTPQAAPWPMVQAAHEACPTSAPAMLSMVGSRVHVVAGDWTAIVVDGEVR